MKIIVDGLELDLLVGADPEIFVKDSKGLVSGHGLVPGTKESPHKVNKGAIQVDGMALEFNIDPAGSIDEFVDNINSVMGQLNSSLPKDLKLSVIPTAEFGAEYIKSQPLIARELGCSSDFNAYTGKANPKPNAEVPFRTAAGHVHIGWTYGQDIEDPDFMNLCCEFTQVLDLYLGVPSVLVDTDVKRRSLYGAAGAFRPKEYGLEYRVLSNFWLKSESYMRWVYSQTEKAIRAFLGGYRVEARLAPRIQQSINNSMFSSAEQLVNFNKLEVPRNA